MRVLWEKNIISYHETKQQITVISTPRNFPEFAWCNSYPSSPSLILGPSWVPCQDGGWRGTGLGMCGQRQGKLGGNFEVDVNCSGGCREGVREGGEQGGLKVGTWGKTRMGKGEQIRSRRGGIKSNWITGKGGPTSSRWDTNALSAF